MTPKYRINQWATSQEKAAQAIVDVLNSLGPDDRLTLRQTVTKERLIPSISYSTIDHPESGLTRHDAPMRDTTTIMMLCLSPIGAGQSFVGSISRLEKTSTRCKFRIMAPATEWFTI